MRTGLLGKTAVITGANGAIGRAIATRLAEEGAHVVLADVAAVDELAATLSDRCSSWHIDLRNEDEIMSGARDLEARFGQVDILVNNAGVLSNHKAMDTRLSEWRSITAVNLDAAFLLTQALLPRMRAAGWGRIINMSSFAAKSGGLTAGTAYSVSKAALIGLTFSVAREVAADGVTVNAIAPAYVVSPMVSRLTAEQRTAQVAAIPVGRFCTPEEVAHTTAFLASPLAGFITGEVIDMNGGLQFD